MSTVFTFPGQGAQEPNMLHNFPKHSVVEKTITEASKILQEDPLTFDSLDALKHTRNVQLCLLIAGVVSYRLLEEQECRPNMVIGFSIGAYAAAVCSGVISFDDALKLVCLRGTLMENAFPHDYGMAAIVGLSLKKVEQIVTQVHTSTYPIFVANVNTPVQIVVAGHDGALRKVMQMAIDEHAENTRRVAISVPSHCDLLKNEAKQMEISFSNVKLNRPQIKYISANYGYTITDPIEIAKDLAYNMANKVYWHTAATVACEYGAKLFVEMLPGSVLTGISRTIDTYSAHVDFLSIANTRLDSIVALHKKYKIE